MISIIRLPTHKVKRIDGKYLDTHHAIHYFINTFKEEPMARNIPKKDDLSKNVVFYYLAVFIVIAGYVFLSIGDANSFTSLTLGPVVLIIGYLIAIPVALLAGVGKKTDSDAPEGKKT